MSAASYGRKLHTVMETLGKANSKVLPFYKFAVVYSSFV